jgi:hypothetical protein
VLVALAVAVGGLVAAGRAWGTYATPRIAVSAASMRTVPPGTLGSDFDGAPVLRVGSGVTTVYVTVRNVGRVSTRIEFPSSTADRVVNGLVDAEPAVLRLRPGASREVALRYTFHCAALPPAATDGASVLSRVFSLTATVPLRERHFDLPLPLELEARHEKGCTP